MKVIGKVDSDVYLCEVSHKEIEQFMNMYYNKMKYLNVGECVDLGKVYNFFIETQRSLKKTEEFIEAHKDVIEMIVTGISIMTRADTPLEEVEK